MMGCEVLGWVARVKPEVVFTSCESLGVRGLGCSIPLGNDFVSIDLGLSLGYYRKGLHPHPLQACMAEVCKAIAIRLARGSSIVTYTHLHGDHVALENANPFQLPIEAFSASLKGIAYLKPKPLTPRELSRLRSLRKFLGPKLVESLNPIASFIEIPGTVSHGDEECYVNCVMVKAGRKSILHLSDSQLLDPSIVGIVRNVQPTTVVVSGPPLYRYSGRAKEVLARKSMALLLEIAKHSDYVIVDHHLLRCVEGSRWLDLAREVVGERVGCVADFAKLPRLLLEAWREKLYRYAPFPRKWFVELGYSGFGNPMDKCFDIVEFLTKCLPRGATPSDEDADKCLRDALSTHLD